MTIQNIFFSIILFTSCNLKSNTIEIIEDEKVKTETKKSSDWRSEILQVKQLNDSVYKKFMRTESLFTEGWDTLAQPFFWKSVMQMSEDSCVINIAKNRQIISKMSVSDWDSKSDEVKDNYRDSVRKIYGLTADDKIFMTTGKRDFYQFDLVIPSISKAVEIFEEQNVDPWYAQAILMIESPGKIAKSNAGALGPFQLMPSVARSHGLKVDKTIDERKDFYKSALGASSLIHNTCLPYAREMLSEQNISYNENDLWFRLFVLHIYHAGAFNVKKALIHISPKTGGMELITTMWQTKVGKFGNASQNYSQLALAAMFIFDEMLWENCDYIVG